MGNPRGRVHCGWGPESSQDFFIPLPFVIFDLRNNIKIAQTCLNFLQITPNLDDAVIQFSDSQRRNLVVSNHQGALSNNILKKKV